MTEKEELEKLFILTKDLPWKYDLASGLKSASVTFNDFEIKVGDGYSSARCVFVCVKSRTTGRKIKSYSSYECGGTPVDDFRNKIIGMATDADDSEKYHFEYILARAK